MYPNTDQIKKIIDASDRVVIVQADNPDADSLGSALALESILGEIGKEPLLYCAVDVPQYLRYMSGWDRVSNELPAKFDASIIVDASTMTLLERLETSGQQRILASKPCIVLDHHQTVERVIPFAKVLINDPTRSSAGELIYVLCRQLGWTIPLPAQGLILSSILGDTQGLSNQLASPQTYRLVADMLEAGVDRPALEELRREFSKMPETIYRYKAALMARTEFAHDARIASVTIPQEEINEYSPLYNPAPLVQGDMLQTSGVTLAIVFKHYSDGKITAAIRSNPGFGVAAELAELFGGGGHANASGFKITDGRDFDQLKKDCLKKAAELIDNLSRKDSI